MRSKKNDEKEGRRKNEKSSRTAGFVGPSKSGAKRVELAIPNY